MASTSTKNLLLSQPQAGQLTYSPLPPALPFSSSYEQDLQVVKVEIPGIDPSTVEVGCEGNVLKVSCEKGEYTQQLDPTIDASKIKAAIMWGLLTLVIPTPPAPVSHTIKVSTPEVASSRSSTHK